LKGNKEMKKMRAIMAAAVAIGACELTSQASPTPINFGTYGIGYEAPEQAQSADLIGNMISVYDGSPATIDGITYTIDKGTLTPSSLGAPLVDLSGSPVTDTATSTSFTVPSGATYLAVKWDGANGGGAYYDVSSLDGDTITLSESDTSVFPKAAGKDIQPSDYEFWSASPTGNDVTVPDGASTVTLFGLTLTGMGLLRKKLVKS
jgi:hypothetical protein